MNHMPTPTRASRRPDQKLTAEQQDLAAKAWELAQPTIRSFRRRYANVEYDGVVGERIVRYIADFDPRQSPLKHWVRRHAIGACLDAMRQNQLVGRAYRGDHEKRRSEPRPKVMQLSSLEANHARQYAAQYLYDRSTLDQTNVLEVHDRTSHLEQMEELGDLLRGASKRERLLVIGYYLMDRTLREIGEDLGLSESRISQMHTALIERLREQHRDRMPAA